MKLRSISFTITSNLTDNEIRNHLIRSLSPYLFSPEHNAFDEFFELEIIGSNGKPLFGTNLINARQRKQKDAILDLFDELIAMFNLRVAGITKETLSSIAVALMGNGGVPGSIGHRSGNFLKPPGYDQIAYRFLRWENDPEISSIGFEMLKFGYNLSDKSPMIVALRHIQDLVGSYHVGEVTADNS